VTAEILVRRCLVELAEQARGRFGWGSGRPCVSRRMFGGKGVVGVSSSPVGILVACRAPRRRDGLYRACVDGT
jgi:hypothetical protein